MKKLLHNSFVVITGSIILALLVGMSIYYFASKKPTPSYFTVERIPLTETVHLDGTVKAAQAVDLAFERSGLVQSVNVSVGDTVSAQKILVALDSADLLAQRDQAQAAVTAQQAKLDVLSHGARPEAIALKQAAVLSAQASLDQAQKSAIDKLGDAYSTADGAVRGTTDQFFVNPRSATPQLSFGLSDSQLAINLASERATLEVELVALQSITKTVGVSTDITQSLTKAGLILDHVSNFLNNVTLALTSANPSGSVTSAVLLSYQVQVTTAKASVQGASSNIISVQGGIKSAQIALQTAQDDLTLANAGGTAEDITAQQAALLGAQANVKNLNAQINKTVMRAPFDAVVTNVSAKVGEVAPPSVPLVSLISKAKFQIESYVPEVDVAKVAVGNHASVTLDAYGGGTIFDATVIAVDPAETVINGAASYKVTLEFKDESSLIKPGMTANVTASGAQRLSAIAVPRQAIITRGDKKFVLVASGKDGSVLLPVTVGIESGDGMVEITSGLEVGQKIVGFSK